MKACSGHNLSELLFTYLEKGVNNLCLYHNKKCYEDQKWEGVIVFWGWKAL